LRPLDLLDPIDLLVGAVAAVRETGCWSFQNSPISQCHDGVRLCAGGKASGGRENGLTGGKLDHEGFCRGVVELGEGIVEKQDGWGSCSITNEMMGGEAQCEREATLATLREPSTSVESGAENCQFVSMWTDGGDPSFQVFSPLPDKSIEKIAFIAAPIAELHALSGRRQPSVGRAREWLEFFGELSSSGSQHRASVRELLIPDVQCREHLGRGATASLSQEYVSLPQHSFDALAGRRKSWIGGLGDFVEKVSPLLWSAFDECEVIWSEHGGPQRLEQLGRSNDP